MATRRIYTISITEDDQAFLFSGIDENVSYTVAPLVLLHAIGDAVVHLASAPTITGFSIVVGSMGLVPSVAEPIPAVIEVIPQGVDCEPDDTELITADYVKCRFPNWETFCTREDGLKTADEMLQIAIDMAEVEMQDSIGAITTVTDTHRFHLLRIVKYNCFNFRHGDTGFEHKPKIVKDYESTREVLDKGIVGDTGIAITSKDRQFDEWFNQGNEWYETN